jgi:hypothetical protein
MTTSILNDALQLRNEDPIKLQEYLHSINLVIFDPIFHTSQNLTEGKQTVLYILCAFSEDSPLLILGQDGTVEKEGICEYLGIPEFMRKKLMELEGQELRRAATGYIIQFGSPLFKALKLIEIQLEDLNLAITNREYKTTSKDGKEETIPLYDFPAHGKAVYQYEQLSKRQAIVQNEIKNTLTFKALVALKEFKFQKVEKKMAKSKDVIAIEGSKLIKLGMNG